MKATKKIVGAACALVAAVALSAGSTFAWFVSNASVKADGLQVDVATSNSYLVISDAYDTLRTGNLKQISLAPSGSATKLKPSAHKEVAESAEEGKIVANSLTIASSWYEGKGNSPTDGSLSTKSDLSALEGYVVEDDIFVSVATGSDSVSSVKLKMTANPAWSSTNEAGTNNSAISVIILYQTINNGSSATTWKYVEANDANNHAISSESDTMLDLGAVTEDDYIQLHVMVYFDGNNEDVKGVNAANLAGVTLNFEFTDASTLSGS